MAFYIEITIPCIYSDKIYNIDVSVGFNSENDFLITKDELLFSNIEDDVNSFISSEYPGVIVDGSIMFKDIIGYDYTGIYYADVTVTDVFLNK